MAARKEDIPHDLYLRAAPANKPTAPLKLYANVTGKFFVEQKLASDNAHLKKLRERTAQATEAKQETRTMMLDAPPVTASQSTAGTSKKRKAPGTGIFRKPLPASSSATASLGVGGSSAGGRKASPNPAAPGPSASGSGSASGSASGSSAPSGNTASHPARPRLIHCLALAPRSADEVVRLVGGSRCDSSTRADLLNLLSDVAEPAEQKSSGGTWRLRQRSWLEVRPFEWPKISEQERISMARSARLAFGALRIPENDPAWANVKFRTTVQHDGSPAPGGNGSDAPSPRRGITSKEAKEKAKAAGTAKAPRVRAGSTTAPSVPSSSSAATRHDTSRTASTSVSASTSLSSATSTSTPAQRPRPAALNLAKDVGDAERDRARAASPLSATSSTQATRRAPPGSGYKSTNRGSTPVNVPATSKTTPVPSTSTSTSNLQTPTDAPKRMKNVAGLPPKPPPQSQTQKATPASVAPSGSGSARRAATSTQDSDSERAREKREKEKDERMKERRKEREREEREKEKEKEREKETLREKEREREKMERQKEKEKEREEEKEREAREKKARERQRAREKEREQERDKIADREREKDRERRERRERERESQPENQRQRKENSSSTSAVKRKKADLDPDDDDDTPLRTKRKLDPSALGTPTGASAADASSSRKQQPLPSSAKSKAQRDDALAMKANKGQGQVKSDALLTSSSLPKQSNGKIGKTQPQHHSSASSSSSSAAGAAATSRLPRNRDVPIYTSSEDEGEIKPSFSSSPPVPDSSSPTRSGTMITKTSKAKANGAIKSHRNTQSEFRIRTNGQGHRAPLPDDRTGLRNRYYSTYGEYYPVFHQMMTQKRLVERLLHDGELDEGEEVMSEDELKDLTERHGVLKGELEAIRGAREALRAA